MKFLKTLFITFFILISINVNSQLPVKYRVEEQSMSTPMSILDDMFFSYYYYSKPINIIFDGSILNMYYDNNNTFLKKEVIKVDEDLSYDKDILVQEKYVYVSTDNKSDTILYIIDYEVKYIQIILPTKNSKNEYIGYTSYRKFIKIDLLSLK